MSDKEVNGWTNKETWQTNLHLGESLKFIIQAGLILSAEEMKLYVRSQYPIEDMFLREAFGTFLYRVNWQELWDTYQTEVN